MLQFIKNKNSRQKFCGVLFLALALAVPAVTNFAAAPTSEAITIYGIATDTDSFSILGTAAGSLYGAGAAVGLICGIQLAVGILAAG